MSKIESTPVANTENNNSLMETIIAMQKQLDALEKKNKSDGITKDNYKGPLDFSYKLRDGVPVSTYKSISKDSSKPLRYKSPNGEFIDNHYVILTFADGKESKPILAYDFGKYHTLSEKQNAGVMTKDGDIIKKYETKHNESKVEIEYYIFDTKDGQINIYPNCIN